MKGLSSPYPANHAETADAHQHTHHFKLFYIAKYELIGRIQDAYVFRKVEQARSGISIDLKGPSAMLSVRPRKGMEIM
jgi:hypothetical protein